MMLSPPSQEHSWAFWCQEAQDEGYMSQKQAPLQVPHPRSFRLRAGQAWLEANRIPCLPYQHKLSISFTKYPLLQEALLDTLAHYSLSSSVLQHRPAGSSTSTHSAAIVFLVLSFPFPSPCLRFCCFSHDAPPPTLHPHVFKAQVTPQRP